MEICSGIWKREESEKSKKDTTRNKEVCNTFHNVMVILVIINFYIEFGTSTNVIQHLIRLSDASKTTKARLEKICQQELGPGVYLNLVARFVSIENPILQPNNIYKIIFVLFRRKM